MDMVLLDDFGCAVGGKGIIGFYVCQVSKRRHTVCCLIRFSGLD